MVEVKIYPYKFDKLVDTIQAIVFENYLLTFGKRRKKDGNYETFAKVTSRTYPFNLITDGEFVDIPVYKKGQQASAKWNLNITEGNVVKEKTIYLFFSGSNSYLHDQPKLPQQIEDVFDSAEVELIAGALTNKDNIFAILSETGMFFDPEISYRQFAIVRSSTDGRLYQKLSEITSTPGNDQKDPYEDKLNWKCLFEDDSEDELNSDNFVDLRSNQNIDGIKTIVGLLQKDKASPQPKANEFVTYVEVENDFLKKEDDAANSKKLAGYETSDIGGDFTEGKQVVVLTNDNGKIDDSFLNATIVSNKAGLLLKVSTTEAADNETVFKTIQEAYDKAVKLIKLSPVTIQVEDGEYVKGNLTVL